MRFRFQFITVPAVAVAVALSSFLYPASKDSTEDHYRQAAGKLLESALLTQPAYSILEQITDIGPRLSGSTAATDAVELTRRIMLDSNFDEVRLEPTMVPHWVRGNVSHTEILSDKLGRIPLTSAAIGGSISTPPSGISAPVLLVRSFEDLNIKGENARGKIIFFNRPMDPALLDTFQAYGEAAGVRTGGAAEAAKAGGIAVLVRSLTLRLDDFPHTGVMHYQPGIPNIPAATVSTKGAELLERMLESDPDLKVRVEFNCRMLSPVQSHNVIGQITGSELPEEIILIGGHLDSWDLSPGAHDDAAGCAQSIAALQLILRTGLKPKRTIRAVMFMNEEFGGSGGRDYASSNRRDSERHLAALESDRGGFLPIALGFGGDSDQYLRFKQWEPLFKAIGLQEIRQGGGGVDIGPLKQRGAVLCSLIPDSQRYFDVHHSAKDTPATVNPRELEMGTAAIALFAYLLAQEGL